MNITVVGAGYVGLSLAVLLSEHNSVTIIDIVSEKIEMIRKKESPIKDKEIEKFLKNRNLKLNATISPIEAYTKAEYIIIATPTDYNPETNYFNTKSIESVIEAVLEYNDFATIVIKSTIPIGYTDKLNKKFKFNRVIFSPEFLREGKALYDNLHPSRIIVGEKSLRAEKFGKLLVDGANSKGIPIIYTNSQEAEAIKLFANTYLAMRVAYFNELDTFAEIKNLDAKSIIDGVCLDPRIGEHYNNPSFGYGGYCLPKDTKQLLATYEEIPSKLIKAIVDSNKIRKKYVSDTILQRGPKTIGIYRLIMKSGSDNFRSSAIFDIIKDFQDEKIDIVIFEPLLLEESLDGYRIEKDVNIFKSSCDVILCNRFEDVLLDVIEKVYTRDIYLRE